MKLLILSLLVAVCITSAHAQRRFYEPVSVTSDVTPQVSASWTNTSANNVARLETPKLTSGAANQSGITIDATSNTASTLFKQFVSAPLSAQTISGTVKAQVRTSISGTTASIFTKAIITVVDPAGNIVATLLPAFTGATAITITNTNRIVIPAGTALTSYTCKTGDRIVFEIGMVRATVTTARTGSMTFGEAVSTDLTEDDTSTATNNPWIEFSQTIAFNNGIF